MTIESQKDVDGLKKIGRIVALAVQEMKKSVRAGMTTRELDAIGKRVLDHYGAKSAPFLTYDFPGTTCISLNHEVAHGIPSDKVIQAGDLINIDVSAELEGYYADTGHSFQIPPYSSKLTQLCTYTMKTMMKVVSQLKAGVKINEIGKIIQEEARKGGYKVVNNLCSHGIGRALHEPPFDILPYYNPHNRAVLKEGQVLTIEPFLSTGTEYVVELADGWTLETPDDSFVAQHEHTIIITKNRPIIVTTA
ncbi:type I methionyl aminopeptidase [Paenibacillus eucommiae]|uniref:Methionine aminopeptidase n=1 Tax=Paenibacillus eucommiae TaxID=1355755 RepID=A0ABS4IRZ2_9BACL|nr:type I methionyl aminopeptidase [Paenibacillus eucommiae]MBP1990323.1 methionyl aminopeptidase [Paenibacillus eucommiae]